MGESDDVGGRVGYGGLEKNELKQAASVRPRQPSPAFFLTSAGFPLSVRVSDAGVARAFDLDARVPAGRRRKASEERTRGTAGEPLAGYGDLVARRCSQKIILRRWMRAGVADDLGPSVFPRDRGPDRGVISDIVSALAGAGIKRPARREQEAPADRCCNETLGTVMA
jgi:hypothetical protein